MAQLKSFPSAKGHCFPLGVSKQEEGLNFSLFSEHAIQITLCLFLAEKHQLLAEIPFNPGSIGRATSGISSSKASLQQNWNMGIGMSGPTDDPKMHFNPKMILSDPYARALNTSHEWGRGIGAIPSNRSPWKGDR